MDFKRAIEAAGSADEFIELGVVRVQAERWVVTRCIEDVEFEIGQEGANTLMDKEELKFVVAHVHHDAFEEGKCSLASSGGIMGVAETPPGPKGLRSPRTKVSPITGSNHRRAEGTFARARNGPCGNVRAVGANQCVDSRARSIDATV